MSLWSWVWDTLTGAGTTSASVPSATRAAVATAEPCSDDRFDSAPIHEQFEDSSEWWTPAGIEQTEPVQPGRPELSADARALEARLISHFDGHNLVLPPLSRVAENVLKRLRNPRCSMVEVAHDLSEDPVSAADVLRMANSPLYRGVEKVASLQTAVARLGSSSLRTLMLHQSLRSAMLHKKAKSGSMEKQIWRRAIAGAAVMRELGKLLHLDPEETFLSGLLHDIGNVVVLQLFSDQSQFAPTALDVETMEYLMFEAHQEFGELISEAWGLPAKLKSLIADHHSYPVANDPIRQERLMILLTDMICQMLGYQPEVQYDLLRTPVVKDLGLSNKPEFIEFLRRLPDRIQELALEYR